MKTYMMRKLLLVMVGALIAVQLPAQEIESILAKGSSEN
jgi:hypothetical protein